MKELKLTTQFKKDLKKYKHHLAKLDALEEVLKKLRNGESLPPDFVIAYPKNRLKREERSVDVFP